MGIFDTHVFNSKTGQVDTVSSSDARELCRQNDTWTIISECEFEIAKKSQGWVIEKAETAIKIDSPILRDAKSIEEILCLATLIANKVDGVRDVNDANEYFKDLEHCDFCRFRVNCLACIINQ